MLPKEWMDYFFYQRINVIRKLCMDGRPPRNFLVEFTRTTPAVITDGPRGLSGSIKMVGFVPRREFIEELADKAYRYAYVERPGNDMKSIACTLLREFYRMDLIDPMLIGGLEMGFKHSWENIKATGKATVLFYTPPETSFEVRTVVEIHDEDSDPYKKYLNSIHDLFHWEGKKSDYPAYVFKIVEIYNNSATRDGFGRKIYP
ncbi:conserved hypothetical protein [Staphylothermus marinus F1]|uniref:Pyridoxamine 5'-phosphate oxidase family protein n=1 Tax=Staphylothermus marinus (strain ATCC 43588 / DSM 3639 / JCM 9404 / F1) TaxID=399550 RepID=A3DPW6_STAMF|nr:hypothetical protein [Staphylothermus marinus]ABN70676.1 conserved hypothetical protein [Staphylothermus marinus F1]